MTVWCRDWPVTAAGVDAATAAMVLAANRVVARSRAAAAAGVAVGQRRRVAQRICPEALTLDHTPDRDMRAFEPVVAAVGGFVPRVEVVDAGCATFEARGPTRYFGGEASLAAGVVDAVAAVLGDGAAVQVGVADGRFASAVAARRGRRGPLVVAPGDAAAFLAPLRVEWLHVAGGVDADLVGLFERLGLRHLGDVAALERGDVLARFGPPGRHALELASAADDRPLDAAEPRRLEQVRRELDPPVDRLEPLVFTAKALADELVSRLGAAGRVCTRLVVSAETDHGERTERAWYRAGGLSAAAMVDRVRWQLGAWVDSGALSAGVVAVALVEDESRVDDGEQGRLWGGPTDLDRRAARAATRIAGLVGDGAVAVPLWAGGHLPADRWRWTAAATVELTDTGTARARLRPPPGEGPWPGSIPAPAPLHLPPVPTPAGLHDRDGAPVQVSGRGELVSPPATITIGTAAPTAVTGWAGPWPLHLRWWDSARCRRVARLQVVTCDGDAYLLLIEGGRWFVAGVYA